MSSKTVDTRFRAAVEAIDSGDAAALTKMLREDPDLVGTRLEKPGAWLRDKIGNAADGFFARPYLLWFVAEDPVRNGKLPQNIAEIARIIIAAAREQKTETLQEQLDYALNLVAWSWIAAQNNVQIPLIDVLADAGAKLDGAPQNALVNQHERAAAHLVERGAPLDLSTALSLSRFDDAERLLPDADASDKQFALVLCGLNGKADAVRWLLEHGADPNRKSESLYSHASPLHHAVCSGDLATVRALGERGADLTAPDTAWSATPIGWAENYVEENSGTERGKDYQAILDYLQARVRAR